MADVLISLGGNVGDVRTTFQSAIAAICRMGQARLLDRSFDYLTPPWGQEDQPPFINACIRIETALEPRDLLDILHQVERAFSRIRSKETHWGPRTLDLDILAYDDRHVDEPGLTIPHPYLFERAFVLVPLADIAPDRQISGRTARQILNGISIEGINRLPNQT